jgi:hypothetical protein
MLVRERHSYGHCTGDWFAAPLPGTARSIFRVHVVGGYEGVLLVGEPVARASERGKGCRTVEVERRPALRAGMPAVYNKAAE